MQYFFALLASAIVVSSSSPSAAVQRVAGVPYVPGGSYSHQLDLFLPPNRSTAPLVVFVHGGAFLQGDRRDVAEVGEALAQQGLATAVVSYRYFPAANAQESTQDVATATAWLIRHAADYGIATHTAFLAGHSAGAQIVALIGTDPKYLRNAGLSLQSIAGVYAVSGAYDVRDLSGEPDTWQRVDGHIYGETPLARGAVSPAEHIDPASPPIEVACGSEEDNPGSCDRAAYFVTALHRAGTTTRLIKENGASHLGMLRALINPKDPLNIEFLDFIARHSH